MKVDLHTHSNVSKDSLSTFDGIVAAVRRTGLDAIALTDHNELHGALELQRYAPFPVIAGEEIMTSGGEIIGLFLHERIPPGLSPTETIARIHEQDGLVYVPHPYDRFRGGAIGEAGLDAIARDVDVLEVFNARNVLPSFNQRALEYAIDHGLAAGAGSDAHTYGEFGHAYVEVGSVDGPESFRAALKDGRWRGRLSSPFTHVRTRIDVLRKRRLSECRHAPEDRS